MDFKEKRNQRKIIEFWRLLKACIRFDYFMWRK